MKDPIESIPLWVVKGRIGHAVKGRNPTTAWCGESGFMGGFFVTRTPARICKSCRESIDLAGGYERPRLPDPVRDGGREPPPPMTQGLLWKDDS